jgi:hypothetical protein
MGRAGHRPMTVLNRSTQARLDGRHVARSSHVLRNGVLWGAIAVALVAGCGRNDAISRAGKMEASRPGIAETKAIAEEGFIYGLPIVMNYAVMYEYAIDRSSGQFKAPFNQIKNEPRVFTYEDTAIVTPNSDTPIPSSGWTCAPSPSSCRCPPWRRAATIR